MGDKIYFFEGSDEVQVLKSMQWKSVAGATSRERDRLLVKLASREYVPITAFVPAYMVESDEEQSLERRKS